MGNGEIRPLTESKPSHWLIWNCEHMNTSGRYAPKSIFVKIRAVGASGEREWWNITSPFFYMSTFFSRKRLQVTPVDRCSRAVAQKKTWNYLRMCLLGVRTLKLISTFYIHYRKNCQNFGQKSDLNCHRSSIKVVQWMSKLGSGIPNLWFILTPFCYKSRKSSFGVSVRKKR